MKEVKVLGTQNSPYVHLSEDGHKMILKVQGHWSLDCELRAIINTFFSACKRTKKEDIIVYFYIDKYKEIDHGYIFDCLCSLNEIGETHSVSLFWYRNKHYISSIEEEKEAKHRMKNYEKAFPNVQIKLRNCSFDKFYKDFNKFPQKVSPAPIVRPVDTTKTADTQKPYDSKGIKIGSSVLRDSHYADAKKWRYIVQATDRSIGIVVSHDGSIVEIYYRGINYDYQDLFTYAIAELVPGPEVKTMNIRIEYMETAWQKRFYDFLKGMISEYPNMIINWYYEHEDEDQEELGQDMKIIVRAREFNIIEVEEL